MTRNRRDEYVRQTLLYFLARLSPHQRLDFLQRAVIEVAKLPGGLGVAAQVVEPHPPADGQKVRGQSRTGDGSGTRTRRTCGSG
jgi:hypothetical protein